MGKQAYIIIHGFEKSYERMAPPLGVIVAVEHSLFWGKFISINLNCQEKMEKNLKFRRKGRRRERGKE
jgi:hypothetical protein